MRTSRRVALVGIPTLVVMLVAAAVAFAHEGWIYSPNGSGKAGTYEAHRHIDWCDTSVDGHRVRARFWIRSVYEEIVSAWDPDGGGGQCGHEPNLVSDITKHKPCAEVDGCSNWVYH